jgi:phage shock protein PspC (stress-responsive transcriptional regulator)
MEDQIKVEEKKEKEVKIGRFKNAWLKLAYMNDGSFCITRLIMICSYILAVGVAFTGIIAYIVWGMTLPSNIYTYVGALTGGGTIQYGITKVNSTINGTTTIANVSTDIKSSDVSGE